MLAAAQGADAFAQVADSFSAPKWRPWWELGGYYGSGDFYNNGQASHGEFIMFAPLTQSHRDLLFVEARGKLYEDDIGVGDFAIGYRQMMMSGFNLGAWVGGDVRNTEISNTFYQLAGGLEVLSENFDARLNWYGPITDPQAGTAGYADVILQGNSISMVGGEEVGLYGIDGEVGARLPLQSVGLDPDLIELRFYGGAYYFDHHAAVREIAGGKARAELRINDFIPVLPGSRLTADYQYSRDDARGSGHEVGARLRLALNEPGATPLSRMSGQERRMVDAIERYTDIVTVQSKPEAVEDTLTGVAFDRVAYVAAGGSITTIAAAAGANSLIIANGAITGSQTLAADQTLQGGASTIGVRGSRSGTVTAFTAPGARATVTNATNTAVLALAGSNAHVAGMSLVGSGTPGQALNDGIFAGSAVQNVFIVDTAIAATGGAGIQFAANGNQATISQVAITNADDHGIRFFDGNSVAIERTAVVDTGDAGIEFGAGNSVSIVATQVADTGAEGIFFTSGNRVAIADTSLSDIGGEGIQFGSSNVASITGTSIAGTVGRGIQFVDFNRATISGTVVVDTNSEGIELGSDNVATIAGSVFSDIGDTGLEFGLRNTVYISGVTVANTGTDGLAFAADNVVALNNTAFTGVIGDDVIDINAAGNTLSGDGNVSTATFAGSFCEVTGAQTGRFDFATGPSNCPP